MTRKRENKAGTEARNVPTSVKQQVLHESGYKCANPRCRYPVTLDVHHLEYVSAGGSDAPENLLPLCPTCHAEHHRGVIPTESLRAWKMLLITLNEAFDRRSVDILLTLDRLSRVEWITGDGIPQYAALAGSDLITLRQGVHNFIGDHGLQQLLYVAELTEKGRMFVDAWKKGDQEAAIDISRRAEVNDQDTASPP